LVFMVSPGPFRIAPYIRVVFLIMTIRYVFYLLKLFRFCYHN
jgi:two pore calcium channel protein